MGATIGELLPLAIGVAVSPIPSGQPSTGVLLVIGVSLVGRGLGGPT
jgi:hypothetical protein